MKKKVYHFHSRVGHNGRLTIPQAVRDAAGLVKGDLVEVRIIKIAKELKEVKA